MRDEIIIPIIFCITLLGTISILCSFLLLAEPKPKVETYVKEIIINGEVYRKVEEN